MVVNDAILQLTGYRPPDLVATIFADQPISTRFADNRASVVLTTATPPSEKGWGYGGGYLPPVLGSASRPAGPLPDFNFAAGMTVVIQPNVIAPGRNAGVQTGELVLVTETGIQRLHHAERGFLRV